MASASHSVLLLAHEFIVLQKHMISMSFSTNHIFYKLFDPLVHDKGDIVYAVKYIIGQPGFDLLE